MVARTFPLDSADGKEQHSTVLIRPQPASPSHGENKTMSIRARLLVVASLLLALIAFPSPSPAADGAFIRINQLGYITGSPARAYLMSKTAETGATFQVLNAKGVAQSVAPIGASLGVWGNFTSTPSISRRTPPVLSRSK